MESAAPVSTITDLKKKEASLREYKRKLTDQGVKRPAKVMKLEKDEELETALFLWFKQRRENGVPTTGAILQAKERELHQRLCEARPASDQRHFTASSGWIWRFCKRHSIRELSLQGEKLSADKPAAELFVAAGCAVTATANRSCTFPISRCSASISPTVGVQIFL